MATVVQVHERECAVCTNDFNTPKILPCGHLLCRECVISWMDSKSHAGCPLCTFPIEHQDSSSQSSSDVVGALPTDFVMEAIVESAHVLVKDDICTVCDDVKAEYMCMQCLEKMCPSCMKIHKKMVVSRSHDVESLNTVTPERLAASRPALCADHGDKQGELFCANHCLVICTSCGSNKHNECLDVTYLDDQMKSADKAIGSLTEVLAVVENNLKQTIGNLIVCIQTADSTEQKNMALVDKTCDRLQKMVEECRKQVKKLISDSISKFKNSLYDVKRELEKRLGKVTSHKHLVSRATTVRPRPALIPAAQTLTDRVHNLNISDELEAEPLVGPSPEIVKYCDDVGKLVIAELQSLELQWTEPEMALLQLATQAPVLVFHENCGRNILLTNCNMTAERTQPEESFGNGVVLSRDAMVQNVLYEVRVDAVGEFHWNTLTLGVTGTPPAQLVVTMWSEDLEDSIIIRHSGVSRQETIFKVNYGLALKKIQVGSRVGVLVGSSNDLHLYVNGQDQGVAAENVPQPCFAIFDVCNRVIQVTALPTSRMA